MTKEPHEPIPRSGRDPSPSWASAMAFSSWPTTWAARSPLPRDYGPASVTITSEDGLFKGIDREQPVWMSHGDSIVRPPDGFHPTAQTDSTPFAGLANPERRLYGIQFHPEVIHTPRGREI